eukprot:83414-Hanusia_phi.AAC.1
MKCLLLLLGLGLVSYGMGEGNFRAGEGKCYHFEHPLKKAKVRCHGGNYKATRLNCACNRNGGRDEERSSQCFDVLCSCRRSFTGYTGNFSLNETTRAVIGDVVEISGQGIEGPLDHNVDIV